MSGPQTHYDVLGVSENASTGEIIQAYREKAKRHHPDVSDAADAQEKFSRITEARDVLTDTAKRQEYDRKLQNSRQSQRPSRTHHESTPPSNHQTPSESTRTTSQRRKRKPDPEDWVGKPGWSQPSEQPSSTQTQTPPNQNTTHQAPRYVVSDVVFRQLLAISLLAYPLLAEPILSATEFNGGTLFSAVLFTALFLVLSATRLGFYVFFVWGFLTPLFIFFAPNIAYESILTVAFTLIPWIGFLFTLLVAAVTTD